MLALSQDLEFVFFRVLCFGKTSLWALFPSSAFCILGQWRECCGAQNEV